MPTGKRIPARPRRLTVGYHYYDQRLDGERIRPRTVPVLRFGGDWLQQAGFAIGQPVQVRVTDRRIVIVPAPVLPAGRPGA